MKTSSKPIKLKRAQKIPSDNMYHCCRFCRHFDLSTNGCSFHSEYNDEGIDYLKTSLIEKLKEILTSEVWEFKQVEDAVIDIADSIYFDESYSSPRDFYCSEWE